MSLKLIILGLLMEGPKHPYAIQSEIKIREMDKYISFVKGSLYYAIKKLAEDGLVRPVGTEDGEAGPERTVYAIESSGKKALIQMIRKGFKAGPTYDRTWVAIIPFMRYLEADERKDLFNTLIEGKEKQIKHLSDALRERGNDVPPIAIVIGTDSLKRIELDIEFLLKIAALDSKDQLWETDCKPERRK